MATKQFLSLEGLTTYDGLIKQYIATEDAKSIKSITVVGNTVNFFKTADASGTAAYTVNLPDVSGFMEKIANATGSKVVVSNSNGSVRESDIDVNDLITKDGIFSGDNVAITNSDGSLSEMSFFTSDTSTPGVVTGYLYGGIPTSGDIIVFGDSTNGIMVATDENENNINIDDLARWDDSGETGYVLVETAEGGIKSTSIYPNDIVTGNIDSQGDEIDYLITSDHTSSGNDVVKSSIATTNLITGYNLNGFDSDEHLGEIIVAYGDPGDYNKVEVSGVKVEDLATNAFVGTIPAGSSATTVVGYVDEVAGSITSASDVTLVEAQTPTTGYLKTYELYQGGNAAVNLVGKIDIPKDLVVTSGEIVVNPTGQPAGTYLKLTIANQTTPVYINVADLCDAYTAASGATQVQLAISNTNEISATLVAGGVGTTELANSAVTEGKIANSSVTTAKINNSAVTTDKIADDAVTADKISIEEYTASNGAEPEEPMQGIVYVSVTTQDGQVSSVEANLDSGYLISELDHYYDTIGTAAELIEGLDATVSQSAGNDGLALQVVEADGVLTSVTGSIAANTYDSYGAASTVQSTVIGTSGDAASANTVYGAKAYADASTAAIATADINALFNS